MDAQHLTTLRTGATSVVATRRLARSALQDRLAGFGGGLLTVLVGLFVFAILPNRIADASWLAEDEKSALTARLRAEEADKKTAGATTLWQGFFDPRVLLTTITCFFLVCANFGTVLWLPQILKALFPSLENVQISLLVSLAFLIGGGGGIVWGRHSDRSGDRKWHITASAVLAAAGYAFAGWSAPPAMQFGGICVGILGIWSIFGVFWAYAGDLLGGQAATGGLALVNSVGSLGGLVAPIALAYALEKYGSVGGSLYVLAAFSVATALLASILKPIAVRRRTSGAIGEAFGNAR
jgi:ACS family tartrate transporter-like MFS transporter